VRALSIIKNRCGDDFRGDGIGVALSWENRNGRDMLIFDPATSEILAEATVLNVAQPT
jgi:hypothetical protein